MEDVKRILVINPGSTSTKIAVFENEKEVFEKTLRHQAEELAKYITIIDQKEFRFNEIEKMLKDNGLSFEDIDAVAARGGIIKPIVSGTYDINEAMVKDLTTSNAALHASALSGLIGDELKKDYNIPAYVVDPVVVDEYQDIARITGVPGVERFPIWHALNQKAIAKQAAKDLGKKYEECNLVVAHMGGGISVAAHMKGMAIDVNNAINGEGPMSPERSGTITMGSMVELCFGGKYTQQDIKNLYSKNGGMVAHLGTNDLRETEKRIAQGDQEAKLFFDAMAYQVAKDIGAMSTVLFGDVDAIVLTGGLAYSEKFTQAIIDRVKFISEVKKYPGEFEIQALALGVLEVLNGETAAKEYK